MFKPHSVAFRLYAFGLGCTFVGAWLTEVTGSMLPLAMGAAASLMCTAPLLKSIRGKPGGRDR